MYGALTRYGGPFQRPSTNHDACSLPAISAEIAEPSHDPERTTPAGFDMRPV